MKKKWILFAGAVLFLGACGLGLYLGTPQIPKRNAKKAVPVQSVASLTGFLGVLSRKEAVTVRLDEGRETDGFLVDVGDPVREGTVLAVYNNSSLLFEKEQLLLDREQLAFDLENAGLQIRALRQERSQAEADQRGSFDLQILSAQAELEQKEYDLSRKDREIAAMEEKLEQREVVSPCEGVVSEADREGGSLSIVPEDAYEFEFSVSEEELKNFRAGEVVAVASRDGELSCEGIVERVWSGNPAENETVSGGEKMSVYPVFGSVEQADGFLAGQHVYIEKAEAGRASEEKREETEISEEEILLPEGYIEDAQGEPWVWAAGEDGKLFKQPVTLGAYNDRHSAWQVTEGLSMTDYLAWPSALLKEGGKADFGE